jgi:hypothetical protein
MPCCGFSSKEFSALETKLHSALTKIPEITKVKVFGLSGLFGFLRELTAPKRGGSKETPQTYGTKA